MGGCNFFGKREKLVERTLSQIDNFAAPFF